jgi:hypothetical protein
MNDWLRGTQIARFINRWPSTIMLGLLLTGLLLLWWRTGWRMR